MRPTHIIEGDLPYSESRLGWSSQLRSTFLAHADWCSARHPGAAAQPLGMGDDPAVRAVLTAVQRDGAHSILK